MRVNSWRPEEDALLIAAAKEGTSVKVVAKRLPDRTFDAVVARLSLLRRKASAAPPESPQGGRRPADDKKAGTAKQKARQRTCLACRQDFASDGPMNRICPRCRMAQSRQMGGTAFDTPATIRYR
jgi:hypothetical protein